MDREKFIQLHRLQSEVLVKKLEMYRKIEETHRGRQGKKLEDALCKVIKDFLPQRYGVVTGRVIDSNGNLSRQSDVIVYDQMFCPQLLCEEIHDQYIQIEAVRAVIEVKSSLTKTAWTDTLKNLESIRKLQTSYLVGLAGVQYIRENASPVPFYLFAFSGKKSKTVEGYLLNTLKNLQENQERQYLKYFPNMVCVNERENYSMVTGVEKGKIREWDIVVNTDNRRDLVLGHINTGKDSLFFFLHKILEEANAIPVVIPRQPILLATTDQFICNVKTTQPIHLQGSNL